MPCRGLEESEIHIQTNRRAPRTVLLRGARQLITLRGANRPRQGDEMQALGIIQDGALLIVDGVIREVGPTRRVERLTEARRAVEVDASGKVVMPGFVDCLARPLHPLASASEFEERCQRGTLPEQAAHDSSVCLKALSAQRLETDYRRRLRQFLSQGTLALGADPGWDGDERMSLKALRVLHDLGSAVINAVPLVAVGPLCAPTLLRRAAQAQLAQLASVDASSSGPRARELALKARNLGYAIRIHGDAGLAVEMDACLAYGGPELTREAAAGLRESGIVWASLPAVDLWRGRPRDDLRQHVDDGVALALATGFGIDGSTVTSLPAVIMLACLHARLRPAEAITATTINAAFALNIADRTGSLAPGKDADLLVLDAADYRELGLHWGSNLVNAVMRRGEWESLAPVLPTASAEAS